MNPPLFAQSSAASRLLKRARAFSLIEVVVAIGIFSFIIVGIIGLFPILLENQKRTVFENRSMLITQHPHSRMVNASKLSAVFLNYQYDEKTEQTTATNHLFWDSKNKLSQPIILGIQADGTSVGAVLAEDDWESDKINPTGIDDPSKVKNITIKAKISLTQDDINPAIPGLYRFDCEVSQPADLPLSARMRSTFTTRVFLPD